MKRTFDILAASLVLIILFPVYALIALLVRWKLGSPVLFRQERAGVNGKPFMMYKFRSMTNDRDEQGKLLSDHERVHALGRFLRSSSLDELPELWNVIRGEMSLVGPRPLFVAYLPYYTEIEARRHEVRPGLTGLAQVSGRNSLQWDERLAMDVQYVQERSWWMDTKILFATVLKVITKQDVDVVTGGNRRLDDLRRKSSSGPGGVK